MCTKSFELKKIQSDLNLSNVTQDQMVLFRTLQLLFKIIFRVFCLFGDISV